MDAILHDAATSTLAWVTLAEPMSVEETRDALKALRDDGVAVDRIVVNRLTQPPPQRCAWCSARRRVEQQARRAGSSRTGLPGRPLALLPADGRRAARPAGARADGPAAGSAGAGAASAAGRRPQHTARWPLGRSPSRGGVPQLATGTHEAVDVRREGRRRQDDLRRGGGHQDRRRRADGRASCCCRPIRRTRSAMSSANGCRTRERPVEGGPSNLLVREIDARRGFAELRERFAAAIDELVDRHRPAAQASAARRPGTIGRCCRICSTWRRRSRRVGRRDRSHRRDSRRPGVSRASISW